MDKPKTPSPFDVLGVAIGLPPAAAEVRLNKLPQELQSPIMAELQARQRSDEKIRAAFTNAYLINDRNETAKQKATDAKHDHLEDK